MEQLNQQLAIVSVIDPDAYGTGTAAGDVIDMALHHRCKFTVLAGDMGQAGTLDLEVQESATGVGAWVAVVGKAITQLVVGNDDNQAVVEVCDDEMTTATNQRYLRGVLTIGGNAVDVAVIAEADRCRYKPSSLQDLASVVEIVQ